MLGGCLAYDAARAGRRSAVLVVPQWMVLADYEQERCEMLVRQGRVAFAVDICGKGVRPRSIAEAGAQAGKYNGNRALPRKRVNAGLARGGRSVCPRDRPGGP